MSAAIPAAPSGPAPRCGVSVIINSFNQEKTIAAAIESGLAAASEVGGEVILADSHSTDRTVEIASEYPIRIVQLVNAAERSRGVAPQLGYQHSRGDYLYILDGGMQMIPGFLPRALAFLAQHPEAAGVGGRLLQPHSGSAQDRELPRNRVQRSPGHVEQLDGGGLYRRRAIEESGYLSDRNLHSREEFDLAVRLRSLGWKLWRIPVDVATFAESDAARDELLRSRWRSASVCGLGELLRAAAGHPRLRLVLRGSRELRFYLGVLAWWCVLLSVPFWPVAAAGRIAGFAALAAAPWLLMLWRTRSPARATYQVASSCLNTAGLVRGLLRPQRPPRDAIASRVLQEPPQASASRREHYA